MPLAGHTPVPARWSEHHRTVATASLIGTCTISRAVDGDGTIDGDGTWHPPASHPVYDGPCQVNPQSRTGPVYPGDKPTTGYSYTVSIVWDAPDIEVGDVVRITSGADPKVVGLQLRVQDVRIGTESFEHVLSCERDLTDREVAT